MSGNVQALLACLALVGLGACKSSRAPAPAPSASAAPAPVRCGPWSLDASSGSAKATGKLEDWCAEFGPCPKTAAEAASRLVIGVLGPSVQSSPNTLVVSYGHFGRYDYAFDLEGQLIGARASNDRSFGKCATQGIGSYSGGVPIPDLSESTDSCGFAPGRDVSQRPVCRCARPTDRGILTDGSRGPTLSTSLDCLYEFWAAGTVCQTTLAFQRQWVAYSERQAKQMQELVDRERRARNPAGKPLDEGERLTDEHLRFSAKEAAAGCGQTRVSSKWMGVPADCVYAADGALVEMRWGERYVTETFDVPCTP